ncbi:hypothetical protein [Parapedobacter lycopersici]|uniref:ABC transporter substrate-binding protein n=1 Tax=Parapedobacter lycopersici TaxID=1864939 RepID=UPI003340046E
MQKARLSLHSILEALTLDQACISLLEETAKYDQLMDATTPEEVYTAIRTVGKVLEAGDAADHLAEGLEERINIIRHKLKFIPREQRPTVLCLQEISPVMLAQGAYLDGLIDIAGGVSYTNWDQDHFNPDIVVLINNRPVPDLLNELPTALATRYWADTNAVKQNNIYLVHHSQYLRQPGAGIADDAEILAEIINPLYFIFGRDADVWMPFRLN